ncbi:hypothetical protein [Occultella kanbiaonis]|uniref:hypothetical protein n=1 Tax=Occultella kanbiaonis TaxID=2675754 RepID=UPI0013D19372|nr:hypothetical protein [Occultella kanbiaonis]
MGNVVTPELIETHVTITRSFVGEESFLRQFSATVSYQSDSGPQEIGSVWGWIGWQSDEEDIFDAADAISHDAMTLGAAAVEIVQSNPDVFIDNILLIDRMEIGAQYRGNRLSGAIIADLLSLLRLDPDRTAVVLEPEPQASTGGPLEDGPVRDAALERLTSAYRASGLEPWRQSTIWWLPL